VFDMLACGELTELFWGLLFDLRPIKHFSVYSVRLSVSKFPSSRTFAQSNAPHILVNGQGQGHMNTQTTTTNQDMVFNLQTILNDIQSRLTKFIDRVCWSNKVSCISLVLWSSSSLAISKFWILAWKSLHCSSFVSRYFSCSVTDLFNWC
jgi:hypothetical protein